MRRAAIAFVVFVVLVLAAGLYVAADRERHRTVVSVMDGLRVSYLLTPARAAAIPHALADDFDVTSAESVLLLAGDALLDVTESGSGLVVTRLTDSARPDSFAWDASNNALLTVTGGYLGQLDGQGKSVEALPVPTGTRVAASSRPGSVYLYASEPALGHRLYAFREDGDYEILVELPDQIRAVADNRDATYVLAGSSIYRVGPNGVRRVISVDEGDLGGAVTSIAVNQDDTMVFFATSRQVFALQGAAALTIVNDGGGTLRAYDDRLFVWDPRRRLLFSVGPLTSLPR
jgi:hypothetical protein